MWFAELNGEQKLIATLAEYDEDGHVTPEFEEKYKPAHTVWEQARLLGYGTPYLVTATVDLLVAARRLIEYRDRAGALNFQLEKADDFINQLRIAVAKIEKQ